MASAREHIRNVEEQRADPGSTLHFTRDLIALRRRLESLRTGAYRELPAPAGSWAWRRGDDVTVALNLGAEHLTVSGVEGSIVLSTNRSRDGEHIGDGLALAPGEGAIVGDALVAVGTIGTLVVRLYGRDDRGLLGRDRPEQGVVVGAPSRVRLPTRRAQVVHQRVPRILGSSFA